MRKALASIAFLLGFVVNPGFFGCHGGDDAPDFGEAEMLETLDAINEIGVFHFTSGGVEYALELSLMQSIGADTEQASRPAPALASRAFACSKRTFMQSAAACIDTTRLLVDGEVSLRDVDRDGAGEERLSAHAVDGTLIVRGRRLTRATLNLQIGPAAKLSLTADDARSFRLVHLAVGAIEYGDEGAAW